MDRRSREKRIRSRKGNLQRRVSFRITPKQSDELDRLIQRGMNPSSQFRSVFDKMLTQSLRRKR